MNFNKHWSKYKIRSVKCCSPEIKQCGPLSHVGTCWSLWIDAKYQRSCFVALLTDQNVLIKWITWWRCGQLWSSFPNPSWSTMKDSIITRQYTNHKSDKTQSWIYSITDDRSTCIHSDTRDVWLVFPSTLTVWDALKKSSVFMVMAEDDVENWLIDWLGLMSHPTHFWPYGDMMKMMNDCQSPSKGVSIHPGTTILEKHGPGGKEEEIPNSEKEKNLRPG